MSETLDNKQLIMESLRKTGRDGIEDLIAYMEDCGFFEAPCSGGNHLCTQFGLVYHTANVLKLAEKISVALIGGKNITEEFRNSIVIAACLHDLGKMGQFGKPGYVTNTLASGKVSEAKPYKTNPDLLYVDHEIRSVAIAQMFIDLTEDEQFAILYHNGMYGALKYGLQGKETPLYMIIHFADMWASRVTESKEKE